MKAPVDVWLGGGGRKADGETFGRQNVLEMTGTPKNFGSQWREVKGALFALTRAARRALGFLDIEPGPSIGVRPVTVYRCRGQQVVTEHRGFCGGLPREDDAA